MMVHGASDGDAWFWFHGAPSCRLEAVLAADWAQKNNIKLIAVDRPGYGGSTLKKGLNG